jgi:hypothetical protein
MHYRIEIDVDLSARRSVRKRLRNMFSNSYYFPQLHLLSYLKLTKIFSHLCPQPGLFLVSQEAPHCNRQNMKMRNNAKTKKTEQLAAMQGLSVPLGYCRELILNYLQLANSCRNLIRLCFHLSEEDLNF